MSLSNINRYIQNTWTLAALWLVHAVMGVLMHRMPILATAHAVLTLLGALFIALVSRRSLDVAYVCAYVVGAEVLWRMSSAAIFYEGAKHVVSICCLIALGRMGRKNIPSSILFYLLALIPSAYILFDFAGFTTETRKAMSFHLSGPLALAFSSLFFANVKVNRQQLWNILFLLATPLVGIAAVTFVSTHAVQEEIAFGTESNKLASGGFGPNQVSAVLGLGLLIVLLYLCQEAMIPRRRMLVFGAALIFGMQSAMTFSRGGLYACGGALALAALSMGKDRLMRARLTSMLTAFVLMAVLVVVPYLIAFTKGAITKRFGSTRMTGREEIFVGDYELWKENPMFGVGIGISGYAHRGYATSHNEFSRLMAEHGILGLFAACCLVVLGLTHFFAARGPREKAIVSALCAWSFLFMASNGFRIAAPAFVYGLSCLVLRLGRPQAAVIRLQPNPSPVSSLRQYPA